LKSDIKPEDDEALGWGNENDTVWWKNFSYSRELYQHLKCLSENLKEDDHSENLGIVIRLILKWIFRK